MTPKRSSRSCRSDCPAGGPCCLDPTVAHVLHICSDETCECHSEARYRPTPRLGSVLLAILFALTLARPMQACPIISVNARPGDTLATIARRYGTTTSAIVAVNHGHALTPLMVGQTISVPACRPVRPHRSRPQPVTKRRPGRCHTTGLARRPINEAEHRAAIEIIPPRRLKINHLEQPK